MEIKIKVIYLCMFLVPGATSNYVREQSETAVLKTAQKSHHLSKLKENEFL